MSNPLDKIQSLSNTVSQGANVLNRIGADLGLGGVGGNSAGAWFAQLQTASFRGIPFGVLAGEIRFGRRNAVHEYPYRDTVWVEDLGRAARRISMVGFLVENGVVTQGGVIAQRQRLIAACELPGDGELVHPTLGRMTVSSMDVSARERWDLGRVVEISFTFVEGGKRVFPGVASSTGDAVTAAAAAADAAASTDFATRVMSAIQKGAAVVNQAVSTAAIWARKAQRLANDATNLFHLVKTLKGSFGRGYGGHGNITQTADSVHSLIAAGTVARNTVAQAASALTTAASNL